MSITRGQLILDLNQLYPRKCDATGQGMNSGFYFEQSGKYFKYEKDAIHHAVHDLGYDSLSCAYDNEAYYWTEWEIDDIYDTLYDAEGNDYKVESIWKMTNNNRCKCDNCEWEGPKNNLEVIIDYSTYPEGKIIYLCPECGRDEILGLEG